MPARVLAAESDPDMGYFKRKALRLQALGIKAVGVTDLHPKPPPVTRSDEVEEMRRDEMLQQEHEAIVLTEIAELDKHAAIVAQHIEALESTSRDSYRLQELKAERRQLMELRAMLEDDLASGPIRKDRNGRALDDRDRAYVRFRSKELRESFWAAAEREAATGDHREARRHRINALRSRQIAEFEQGWRNSLAGYGLVSWN